VQLLARQGSGLFHYFQHAGAPHNRCVAARPPIKTFMAATPSDDFVGEFTIRRASRFWQLRPAHARRRAVVADRLSLRDAMRQKRPARIPQF
jgi:hypothetical protein